MITQGIDKSFLFVYVRDPEVTAVDLERNFNERVDRDRASGRNPAFTGVYVNIVLMFGTSEIALLLVTKTCLFTREIAAYKLQKGCPRFRHRNKYSNCLAAVDLIFFGKWNGFGRPGFAVRDKD